MPQFEPVVEVARIPAENGSTKLVGEHDEVTEFIIERTSKPTPFDPWELYH